MPGTPLTTVRIHSILPRVDFEKTGPPRLPIGIEALDRLVDGIPRGSITELTGRASSGRTAFAMSVLASATARGEICAVVDARNSWNPESAQQRNVALDRVLWVRCGNHVDKAFHAADLILKAGGFGVVWLDLGEIPERQLSRIPLSHWHRFRKTIENTNSILLALSLEACGSSCSALRLNFEQNEVYWAGAIPKKRVLCEVSFGVHPQRSYVNRKGSFQVQVAG
jgi:hypothetical protein